MDWEFPFPESTKFISSFFMGVKMSDKFGFRLKRADTQGGKQ